MDMFKTKKVKEPVIEPTTLEYLEGLTVEELKRHSFTGFSYELTTVSGNKHQYTFYIRQFEQNEFHIKYITDRRYIESDFDIEVLTDKIESLKVIEQLETFVIGPKAWKSIQIFLIDDFVTNVNTASIDYIVELLEMDNNESLNFK